MILYHELVESFHLYLFKLINIIFEKGFYVISQVTLGTYDKCYTIHLDIIDNVLTTLFNVDNFTYTQFNFKDQTLLQQSNFLAIIQFLHLWSSYFAFLEDKLQLDNIIKRNKVIKDNDLLIKITSSFNNIHN